MHPVLDYGSSVWHPKGVVFQEEVESVEKRTAKFVTGNYNYETGSMIGILGQLKWESLKKRRKDNRLILLYKGLKGKASILIYLIALYKIYILYQYRISIWICSIQAKCWKSSEMAKIAYNYLLILLNLSPNKSPFNQYYPRSVQIFESFDFPKLIK